MSAETIVTGPGAETRGTAVGTAVAGVGGSVLVLVLVGPLAGALIGPIVFAARVLVTCAAAVRT